MVNRLRPTSILDYKHHSIQTLVLARGWRELPYSDRIGAIYNFVRDEIAFGYNVSDEASASVVLADGYGQCNTKTSLLMALFRAADIPCRFHGATIHKRLQKGVVNGSPTASHRKTSSTVGRRSSSRIAGSDWKE